MAATALFAMAVLPAVPGATPLPGQIGTFAGGPGYGAAMGVAQRPYALVARGNYLFIADGEHHVVRSLNLDTGTQNVIAGNGVQGYSGDGGFATNAALSNPGGLAFDATGALYIADSGNHRIRRVDQAGFITTVAGTSGAGFAGDGGPATSARLSGPRGVAIRSDGSLLIADAVNARIRRVDSFGTITTIAGTGLRGTSGDGGPATAAQLWEPSDLSLGGDGSLLIADPGGNRIRRIDTEGIITTVAGSGTVRPGDGGDATVARLSNPYAARATADGGFIFADTWANKVRKVDADGLLTTLAGDGTQGFDGDGAAPSSARLNFPMGVEVAGDTVYVADTNNFRVRVFDEHAIDTIAGNGKLRDGGDGGSRLAAQLSEPTSIIGDGAGGLYIADSANNRVRHVDRNGTIASIAGDGTYGYEGDGGPASLARLAFPTHLALDEQTATLYIADAGNARVRAIDGNGVITTVAGNGSFAPATPGSPARSSPIRPRGMSVDEVTGALIVADGAANRVWRIGSNGILELAAGTGVRAFSGDGGPATAAALSNPSSVAVLQDGSIAIADQGNRRIRLVESGLIRTLAGPGSGETRFDTPVSVSRDGDGLLVADTGMHRITRVTLDGMQTLVAGSSERGYGGDGGAAEKALLARPSDAWADGSRRVYIADAGNSRIRVVAPNLPVRSAGSSNALARTEGCEAHQPAGPATCTYLATESGSLFGLGPNVRTGLGADVGGYSFSVDRPGAGPRSFYSGGAAYWFLPWEIIPGDTVTVRVHGPGASAYAGDRAVIPQEAFDTLGSGPHHDATRTDTPANAQVMRFRRATAFATASVYFDDQRVSFAAVDHDADSIRVIATRQQWDPYRRDWVTDATAVGAEDVIIARQGTGFEYIESGAGSTLALKVSLPTVGDLDLRFSSPMKGYRSGSWTTSVLTTAYVQGDRLHRVNERPGSLTGTVDGKKVNSPFYEGIWGAEASGLVTFVFPDHPTGTEP